MYEGSKAPCMYSTPVWTNYHKPPSTPLHDASTHIPQEPMNRQLFAAINALLSTSNHPPLKNRSNTITTIVTHTENSPQNTNQLPSRRNNSCLCRYNFGDIRRTPHQQPLISPHHYSKPSPHHDTSQTPQLLPSCTHQLTVAQPPTRPNHHHCKRENILTTGLLLPPKPHAISDRPTTIFSIISNSVRHTHPTARAEPPKILSFLKPIYGRSPPGTNLNAISRERSNNTRQILLSSYQKCLFHSYI